MVELSPDTYQPLSETSVTLEFPHSEVMVAYQEHHRTGAVRFRSDGVSGQMTLTLLDEQRILIQFDLLFSSGRSEQSLGVDDLILIADDYVPREVMEMVYSPTSSTIGTSPSGRTKR